MGTSRRYFLRVGLLSTLGAVSIAYCPDVLEAAVLGKKKYFLLPGYKRSLEGLVAEYRLMHMRFCELENQRTGGLLWTSMSPQATILYQGMKSNRLSAAQ